jgi:Fe(3+) dicitrate transport protein
MGAFFVTLILSATSSTVLSEEAVEPIVLPEIVVTATPIADPVPEVPLNSIGSRNVLDPDDVKETGAKDLNQLIQHIPAISARPYNGGEAGAPSFSMRGLPDDGLTEFVLVLIDGIPASPLPYGWTAFSFMPITPERIYAIDYIRGGHSVRYSPNTVSGVLNFITPPIPLEKEVTLRGTIGENSFKSFAFSGGGSGEKGEFSLFAVGREGDGYRDKGEFDQQDFNAKFTWNTGANSWFATSLSYMEDEHQAPGGLTQVEFNEDRFGNSRPENRFDGSRLVADLAFHYERGAGRWWEAFGYVSKTERHLRAQRPHFGTPSTVSDWTDDSYFTGVGIRWADVLKLGNMDNNLYGGIRYQREWIPSWKLYSEPYPSGSGTLTQDAEYTLETFSLHLDDTFSPLENLTLMAGARLEWIPEAEGDDSVTGWKYDDDYFNILPGLGASYLLTDRWSLFGNYFHGFRAPQVWGYAYAVPNADLKFEEGQTAEIGSRFRNWKGFTGAVTGWRTEYDDFGVLLSGYYENLGRIVAEGVDFELLWDAGYVFPPVKGLTMSGSLTLQESNLRHGQFTGNDVPYAWKKKATWQIRYEKYGWIGNLLGTYVGESFSDSANTDQASADGRIGTNPSRVVWDFRLSKLIPLKKKWNLELAAGATNLFDKEWYVHSRGGFFGGGLVSGPPRETYGSVFLKASF